MTIPPKQLVMKLKRLAVAFPQREIPDETILVYAERLATLPLDDVLAAIDRLMDTAKFFPSIAEIKEAAVVGPYGASLADEAWIEVQREARRVGFNRPRIFMNGKFLDPEQPTFSSSVVAHAAAAVGWELICTGDDSRGFIRDQFVKAFKALSERETKAKQAGVVSVESEALPMGVPAIGNGRTE